MVYTTIALISAEVNGATIDGSSTPSSTSVSNWITEVSSEIDLRTGKTWTSTTSSSSILDYDGTGYLRTPGAPIISVTTLEYNKQGLGSSSSDWTSLTEGRTNNFVVHKDDGEIEFFGSTTPSSGSQRVRLTYVYGYSTTPSYIQRLATLMASRRYIQSVVLGTASDEGGSVTVGDISITDPSDFSSRQLRDIDSEINQLIAQYGVKTSVFRPARNYSVQARY